MLLPFQFLLRLIALILLSQPRIDGYYISHTVRFPDLPMSAGMYHIHSPAHFMTPHGFALPGFKLLDIKTPLHPQQDDIRARRQQFSYTEFHYQTYFHGPMSGKLFSDSVNTSHIVLRDPDGLPCLIGKLSLTKCASRGHAITVNADLLRPASVWERMFGGNRLVHEPTIRRAIRECYSDMRQNMELLEYLRMLFELQRVQKTSSSAAPRSSLTSTLLFRNTNLFPKKINDRNHTKNRNRTNDDPWKFYRP